MATISVNGIEMRLAGRLVRVARLAAEQFEELVDPVGCVEWLRRSGVSVDVLTFVQALPDTTPRYAYHMELDNLAALPVSTFDHWWTKQIDGKTRNMVRRAERAGVVVREVAFDDALVRGIKAVYDESPIRQGRHFWHYGKTEQAISQENGTFVDRSVFIGAFVDDALVGFAKIVPNGRRSQAGLMQIVSMIGQRDKAPTNALIAQAVRSCADRNLPYLFYSRFSFGKRQGDSLSAFKESNGLRRIDLPRYYIPLTRTGELAIRHGLHRAQAIDYVPARLQAPLRAARDQWISWWYRPARRR